MLVPFPFDFYVYQTGRVDGLKQLGSTNIIDMCISIFIMFQDHHQKCVMFATQQHGCFEADKKVRKKMKNVLENQAD